MKHLPPLLIVLGFTLLGELLHTLLPLPLPAAIYGLVLLFLALMTGLISVETVKPVSGFLIGIMPVLFVAPAVSLLDSWQALASKLAAVLVIVAVSTALVFAVSGWVTQWLLGRKEKRHD